jgi:hypothetical protein
MFLAVLFFLALELVGGILGSILGAFLEAAVETWIQHRRGFGAWDVPRQDAGRLLARPALYAGIGFALGSLSLSVMPERVAPAPWARALAWTLGPVLCGLTMVGLDLLLERVLARPPHRARAFACGTALALAYVAIRGAAFRG